MLEILLPDKFMYFIVFDPLPKASILKILLFDKSSFLMFSPI